RAPSVTRCSLRTWLAPSSILLTHFARFQFDPGELGEFLEREAAIEVNTVGDGDVEQRFGFAQHFAQAVDDAFDDCRRNLTLLEANGHGVLAFANLDAHAFEARARLIAEALDDAEDAVGRVESDALALQ